MSSRAKMRNAICTSKTHLLSVSITLTFVLCKKSELGFGQNHDPGISGQVCEMTFPGIAELTHKTEVASFFVVDVIVENLFFLFYEYVCFQTRSALTAYSLFSGLFQILKCTETTAKLWLSSLFTLLILLYL